MDYARSVKKKKIDFFKEAPLWQASLFFIKRGPLTRSDGDGDRGIYVFCPHRNILYIYFAHQDCKNRYRIENKMIKNRIPVPLPVNKIAIENPNPQNH